MTTKKSETGSVVKKKEKSAAKAPRLSGVVRYGQGFEKHLKNSSDSVRKQVMELVDKAVKLVEAEKAEIAQKKKNDAAMARAEKVKINQMRKTLGKFSKEEIEEYLKSQS